MFPAGVYVAVPVVGETTAVLFDVVAVEILTVPSGVKFPVKVSSFPEKVG